MRDARTCRFLLFLIVSIYLGGVLLRAAAPLDSPAARRRVSSSAPQSLQIVDAAGRNMRLDRLPRRIVVVGKGPHMLTHLLYMFPEGRERLAGMEKRGKSASDFLPLVDPEFPKKTMLGMNPGPEQVATVHPDLVLIKGSAAEKMSEALGKINIPVVYLSLESPDEFFRDVTNLGIILGNEKRAGEIVAFYRSRVERIRKAVAGVRESDKPRVLVVMGFDRGGKYAVQVPAVSWMQTIQVRAAGAVPIWLESAERTSGWTIVNLEQIARWDPDKIFVVVWHTIDPKKMMGAFKADPQWAALKAVKNKELYVFPTDVFGWDSPEPRWILGMTWLSFTIHPECFTGLDMTEEIRQYFELLYGMDRKAVDEKILPAVRMDVR